MCAVAHICAIVHMLGGSLVMSRNQAESQGEDLLDEQLDGTAAQAGYEVFSPFKLEYKYKYEFWT